MNVSIYIYRTLLNTTNTTRTKSTRAENINAILSIRIYIADCASISLLTDIAKSMGSMNIIISNAIKRYIQKVIRIPLLKQLFSLLLQLDDFPIK